MDQLTNTVELLVQAIQQNLFFVLSLLAAIWGISILNWLMGGVLNIFGIYPRSIHGLLGIPCSPFLHGHFNHLFFNSIPLFVLATLVLVYGKQTFYCTSAIIIILSGSIVWLVGRKAIHVGASGLVMGYWSYLLINTIQQQTGMAIILGIISIYYFGGLFLDLFPSDSEVSIEGHLSGFAAGIAATYLCPILGLF